MRKRVSLPTVFAALSLAVSASAGAPPALMLGAGASRVLLDEVAVDLPPRVEFHSVGALGGAWAAAGVEERDGGRRLSLWSAGADAAAVALPSPAAAGEALEEEPVLLSDGRSLVGLAWLAGEDRRSLAVRFAPWRGAGWGAVEEVAGTAPGSQLALAGTVLEDGVALLAWSRFDGVDDEIFWSRRDPAGGWSEPRPLAADNAVPDITPALVTVPGGALATWNRYRDGRYVLVASRWSEGGWSEPRPLAPGALYPSLTPRAGGAAVLYWAAGRRAWELLEVDGDGHPRRRAVTGLASPRRPAVTRARDGGLALRSLAARSGEREVAVLWEDLP